MARRQRLRRLLSTVRAALAGYARLGVWFYNLDNHRPDHVVARELKAIASTDPALIGLCEVIGNTLPDLPGYRLLRDRSTEQRTNIACYVRRRGLPTPRHVHWLDMHERWTRPDRPGEKHPGRSFLVFSLWWFQIIVGHQAPKGTDNTAAAQAEGIVRVTAAMAPWTRKGWTASTSRVERMVQRLRPRLLIWDGNRRVGEDGPGPGELAAAIGGHVYLGDHIDHAVARGQVDVLGARKVGRVGDVDLASDHRGAIRMVVKVLWVWLGGTPASR